MAVSIAAAVNTVEISEREYSKLVRESEQLRILKAFINREEVIIKKDIELLIKAMEANNE